MAHVFQVGAGSGGIAVIDLIARDRRVDRLTLVEPDVFKPHNVVRHMFGPGSVGRPKADLAVEWLRELRPDLTIEVVPVDLTAPDCQGTIGTAVAACDIGVCAVDNEPAKFHFDWLMRTHGKPWTLGEVLSGGIGGWVHRFRPGGACYGCVASALRREIVTDNSPPPDYSDPDGAVRETTVPADKASIAVIAGLHALLTLESLAGHESGPDFTSLLLSLRSVPGVFEQPPKPYRFPIPRDPECLICGRGDRSSADAEPDAGQGDNAPSGEDLDVALDRALARLGDE